MEAGCTTALGTLAGSWSSLDRCDGKSPSDRCNTHSGCVVERRDMAYTQPGECAAASAQ